MYFKVLTVNLREKIFEGLDKNNNYVIIEYTYLEDCMNIYPKKEHKMIYLSFVQNNKRCKDEFWFENTEIEDTIINLLCSEETENKILGEELLRQKKEG